MGEMTLNAARVLQLKTLSACMVLAWSLPAHALTLGKFQVQSAMGEPLRAEVEITQHTPDELRGLQTQLAAPRSFQQAGMEFNSALAGVTTAVENRADGRHYIVLNGRSPIQDSFIDLILEAQWSTGRLVKNYALLLNSAAPGAVSRQAPLAAPVYQPQTEAIASPVTLGRVTAPVTSPSSTLSSNPTSVEVNADQVPVYRFDSPDASPASNVTRPTPLATAPLIQNVQPLLRVTPINSYSPRSESYAGAGDAMHVSTGDTASNLLMGRLPANVSLDQMLLALVRANPNAFIEGNVNLVRAGTVLRMPKASEATQISRAEARQTVIAQHREFASYARRVAESPLLVGSAQSREMTGNVSKEAPSAPAAGPKQDKLTLSKAQDGKNSAEAKLAAEREAKDTADQLKALNKNMQDMEALAKDRKDDTAVKVTSSLPDATNTEPGLLEQLSQNKSIWAWTIAALLALMALVFWSRRKSAKSEAVFAPSYDDGPSPAMGTSMNIPPQMAGIDLNLNSSPAPQAPVAQAPVAQAAPVLAQAPVVQAAPVVRQAPLAPVAPTPNEVTEHNKLALASQLLASGDTDLARTLIMSVASTASGEHKARALQMLGQIA
jgi:FimV-like protein